MEFENLPKTYEGYQTEELLKVWEEIKTKEGTKAPVEKIQAMRRLLREFKLGVHQLRK